LSNFDSFALDQRLAGAIRDLGYEKPTPIQERAIPVVLEGRDVIGLAQTGTGKTAAFALPILQRLVGGPRGRLRALILAPTRELAEQIHQAILGFSRKTGLRSATVYGGVPMYSQRKNIRGADIVVACPGRLLDQMSARAVELRDLEVLVLDEADRMLDMGFLPDIRRIVKQLPTARQTLLFSATMPDEVRQLTRDLTREATTVQVDRSKPAATVSHAVYPVESHRKTDLLKVLLDRLDIGSVLVFTRTKHRATRLATQLKAAGHASTALQGNLSQGQRQRAIGGFRDGSVRVLVATDIAARGIDVSTVSHVINYDIPDTVDAYVHRSGRTGRAERTGDAFTFVAREDGSTVRAIERALGAPLERKRVEGFDYGAPPSPTQPLHPEARRHHHAPAGARRGAPGPRSSAGPRGGGGNAPSPRAASGGPRRQRNVW
jgi:ATP-dependent RNA helicase RhlE